MVGLGEGENYLASDIHALLPLTRRFIYLAEGDVAEIRCDSLRVFDEHGAAVTRPVKESHFSADAVERGEYRHAHVKEIHEQPRSIADTLEGRIAAGRVLPEVFGVGAAELAGEGRSRARHRLRHAFDVGLVARYWIESLAGLPCTTEIASEYRYRSPVVRDGTLFVTISQSGETADTLAALKLAQQRNYLARLVVCNVPESSLVRESALVR